MLQSASLIRVYVSDPLGAGSRVVTATVQIDRVVGTPDVVTPRISISNLANMNDAELADYQTFINTIDEESTLAQGLVVLDSIPGGG